MLSLLATSPAKTIEIGSRLGRLLTAGDFVNLNGELGAGKTLLVKGLGMGLGISAEEITSPTFTIINEYLGAYPLYHFDFYRLEHDYELEQIGYEDYFYGEGITVVEWGNLFAHYLPPDRLDVLLEALTDEERTISISARGKRSGYIVEALRGQS